MKSYLYSMMAAAILLISCSKNEPDTENNPVTEKPEEKTPIVESPDKTMSLVALVSNVSATTKASTFDFTDFNLDLNVKDGLVRSWTSDFIDASTKIELKSKDGLITSMTVTDTENVNSAVSVTDIFYDSSRRINHLESSFQGEKYEDYNIKYDERKLIFEDLIGSRDRDVNLDGNERITFFSQEGYS
ncbi:MAG: hypothetical protein WA913_11635, partial [Pricia sp.]